jgi:hypothetical protein
MVMGHYAVDFLIHGGCPQIAVQLREPRARLLSLYRCWQGLAPETIAGWGSRAGSALRSVQLPLPGFLRSLGAWPAADNAVARHLLGHHTPAEASRARHQLQQELAGDGYQTVRHRIRIVEWSSDSQRFADRLCTALDLDPVTLPRVNETSVSGAVQVLDADCPALLEELTSIDKWVIDRIMSDGLVRARSPEDFDAEFRAAAEHLRFVVQ